MNGCFRKAVPQRSVTSAMAAIHHRRARCQLAAHVIFEDFDDIISLVACELSAPCLLRPKAIPFAHLFGARNPTNLVPNEKGLQ